MRNDNSNFSLANTAANKEPRFVIQLSFDNANTDLVYLTSHLDTATPSGAVGSGLVVSNVVNVVGGQSQQLNPDKANSSIGGFSFNAVDYGEALTVYMRDKLAAGDGLRYKQVVVYVGHIGDVWADYQAVLTYIIDKDVEYDNGVYKFSCSDIQRIVRKNIFDPEKTTLSKTVSATQLHIPVHQTNLAKFPTVEHDASYTDRPNQTVSYARIEDEVFCHSGLITHATDGVSFQVVANGRGALNSRATEHTIDTSKSNDRQIKITEHIFIEGPAPKIVYALLTGNLENQPGKTLPDNWHLGVSTNYVRLSDFTGIDNDLWDTATEAGRHVRFEGVKKTDGKKFIEQELLFWIACFMPVYADGALGLRKLSPVLSGSGYLAELDRSNIVSYSGFKHDYSALINEIDIVWNYVFLKDDYSKNSILIDAGSISKHNDSPKKTIKLRGVHTGSHADEDINSYFDSLRDRFSGPPLRLSVEVLSSLNALEVGDTVNVDLPQIRDFTVAGQTKLNRVFEIQKVSTNWITGNVKLDLFGSSQKAGALEKTVLSNVLDDAFYPSAGIELSTVLTIVGGVVTFDGSLTGAALLSNAIYYYEGNLEIAAGVTVTISHNVQLRVRGFLTVNGKIDGKGQGHAGGVGGSVFADNGLTSILVNALSSSERSALDNAGPGIAGYLGATKSAGNVYASGHVDFVRGSRDGITSAGKIQSVPNYVLVNASTSLTGLPTDLRGTSGAGGRFMIRRDGGSVPFDPLFVIANGGAGGNGGAGLLVISRGLAFGASGSIDTSGDDGVLGGTSTVRAKTLYAGSGGGGVPGGLVVMLDGQSTPPELITGHVANQGNSPIQGTPVIYSTGEEEVVLTRITAAQMVSQSIAALTVEQRNLGFSGHDWIDAAYGLQYIPEVQSNELETDAPPPDLEGFVALNSGDTVVFKWNPLKVGDGVEIRYSPDTVNSWEDATPLTIEAKGTRITDAAINDGSWRFYAKELLNGVESLNAVTSLLVVTSNFDIILENTENPLWPGTLTNFYLHHTGVLIPKSQDADSTDGWNVFDIAVPNPFEVCTYETNELDSSFDDAIRLWGEIESSLLPGETGTANPLLEADYRKAADSYDGFESWGVGEVEARYAKFKLTLNTVEGVAKIDSFKTVVDLLERVEQGRGVTVPAPGLSIVFAQPYHTIPSVNPRMVGGGAVFVTASNITTSGCDFDVFNISGVGVSGVIDYDITGV